jgi:hypothetical protein
MVSLAIEILLTGLRKEIIVLAGRARTAKTNRFGPQNPRRHHDEFFDTPVVKTVRNDPTVRPGSLTSRWTTVLVSV